MTPTISGYFPHGLVDMVCDPSPEKRMLVSREWVARATLLCGGPATVRLKLAGDGHDNLPSTLYAQGLSVWKGAGWHVNLVLPMEFSRPWLRAVNPISCYPNEKLGYNSDPLLNQWIDIFSKRACGVLHRLAGLFDSVTFYNEPNENAEIPVGHNVPPGSHAKPTSVNQNIAAALFWQLGSRLRSPLYNVKVPFYIGSFSCLGYPIYTNPASDWVGKFLGDGLDMLDAHGKRHMSTNDQPYPFNGVALNMEGYFDAPHALRVKNALQAVMGKHGWAGPLIVGECGIAGNPDPVRTLETLQALTQTFPDGVTWFQNAFYTPGMSSGYGLQDWTVKNGAYYTLGDPKPIAATVGQAFAQARSQMLAEGALS